jgi:hypothetical protein
MHSLSIVGKGRYQYQAAIVPLTLTSLFYLSSLFPSALSTFGGNNLLAAFVGKLDILLGEDKGTFVRMKRKNVEELLHESDGFKDEVRQLSSDWEETEAHEWEKN